MEPISSPEECVELAELRETHARLRLHDEEAVRGVRDSLRRHGQLVAVAVYQGRGGLEVVDGFKRLRAASELGWPLLRVQVLALEVVQAKAAMRLLNSRRGMSELEEAWLVRSLYREDGVRQPEIGRLLGRHKSWVSRRLLLAEGLEEEVQAQVRLGLLAASTATLLARLPQGNQLPAAEGVRARGLTKHQVERLVTQVLARPVEERDVALTDALARQPAALGPATSRHRQECTPVQGLMDEITAARRLCARLQARLLAQPLGAFGERAAQVVGLELAGLSPVLGALSRTVEQSLEGRLYATVEDARRA